jgi:nucleoside-diphosphate-sugar epimerase
MAEIAESLAGKKTLVTGAAGFIGGHLVRALDGAGATVHATWRVRPPDSAAQHSALWRKIDLRSVEEVDGLFSDIRPDVVFHLASHVSGSRLVEAVLPTFHDNLASTLHLLMGAARHQPCRMVLAGSMEEPGGGDGEIYSSPYAASKAAACGYARMFHALYEVPVSVARIFMVYGPAQMDDKKLVPYSILSLLRGEPPEISSGVRKVDWIFVDDLVSGLIALAAGDRQDAVQVDLGSGVSCTVAEVVEEICRQIDSSIRPNVGAVQDRVLEQEPVANLDATREVIGWAPQVSLPEGIARTIAWYRAQQTRATLV